MFSERIGRAGNIYVKKHITADTEVDHDSALNRTVQIPFHFSEIVRLPARRHSSESSL